MGSKSFVINIFIITILFLLVISLCVYYSVINHPLYQESQSRIAQSYIKSEIVFVGDSSLGNGLDSKLFSEISGIKTLNLSLSADAHNFAATYNMIRHVVKNNSTAKYIVIMQTPMVWHKEFILGGYCSTLGVLDSKQAIKRDLLDYTSCFKYHFFNIKQIYTSYLQKEVTVKNKNAILKTYKNGGRNIFKEIEENRYLNLNKIGNSKKTEIKMIDEFLQNKNVKVFYVQGSLHYQLSKKYEGTINQQQKILRALKNIKFIDKYLYPKNENMGNTENHVDRSYKETSTSFYYEALKPFINGFDNH